MKYGNDKIIFKDTTVSSFIIKMERFYKRGIEREESTVNLKSYTKDLKGFRKQLKSMI